ncbi:MAG: hypothetical protein U5N53_28455 [Mycobacterium sp.]|nr:hypothetical protein [Mycobacterium sp.]
MTLDNVLILLGVLGFVLSVAQCVPRLRKRHKDYMRARWRHDGWTLPTLLCGCYWIGVEQWAPKRLRRTREPEPPEWLQKLQDGLATTKPSLPNMAGDR